MIIFILPSVRGLPPRAMLIDAVDEHDLEAKEMEEVSAVEVMFSQDLGLWMSSDGRPLPQGLGAVLTERAKELGVPWE